MKGTEWIMQHAYLCRGLFALKVVPGFVPDARCLRFWGQVGTGKATGQSDRRAWGPGSSGHRARDGDGGGPATSGGGHSLR